MNGAAGQLIARARSLSRTEPVPSPCTSVCRIEPATGWCEGCFRTIDEIAAWSGLDDAARRATWQALVARAASSEERA